MMNSKGGAARTYSPKSHPIAEIVSDVVAHRELLFALARRDIKIRYKQAVMGFAWAILLPSVIVLAGILVRFAIGLASEQAISSADVASVIVKSTPWAFVVGTISFATNSLVANFDLITKIAFPREVLPLAAVLTQLMDFSVALVAAVGVLWFLGIGFNLSWLWAPLLVVNIVVLCSAAAVALSCANLFFRDVKYLVQIFLMFGIFVTPVFFDVENFGPNIGPLLMINPLAPMLEGLRLALVDGHSLLAPLIVDSKLGPVFAWSPWYLVYSFVFGFGSFLASLIVFHKLQFTFAEYI